MQRFRTNQVDVLVATDIAARGIDISDISHVFNYDLPEEDESYIHRIGRAGRAGKEGISISLCCHEELGLLASIEKMLKKEIPLIRTEYSIELKRKKASADKSNRRPSFKKKLDSRRSVIKTSVITKRNVMMVHRINRCINLQSQISHVSLLIESHVIKQRITSQEEKIMIDKENADSYLHFLRLLI